ncbi:MAG: 4-alpha-glucanotransferase [Dorea sp.]
MQIPGRIRLFQLDEENLPVAVAGCPPDAFSATGQLWGNPLYEWDYHKKTGYDWWMKRVACCFKLYDIIRIDHFRGFDEYSCNRMEMRRQRNGEWILDRAWNLFRTMKKH